MREIILRAKQKSLAHEKFPNVYPKEDMDWVYSNGYYFDGINYWFLQPNKDPNITCLAGVNSVIVDPKTISQFTGDKEFSCDSDGNTTDGKGIFDGDILEIVSKEDGNGVYLVFWNDEKAKWDWKFLRGSHPTEDYIDGIKAIGNRWDNPGMLKSKVD
jgi:hypothetical protein